MRTRAILLAMALPATAAAQQQSAVLEPSRFVEVRSVIEGRLTDLPVAEGQTVARGDTLAAIDAAVQARRVEMARAMAAATGQIEKSQAALDMAERVQERIASARASGAAQEWEVEQAGQAVALAHADREVAREEVARFRAQLALEQATLEQYTVRAPFDATVLEIFKEVGGIVTTDEDVIMEVGDLGTLKATMFVPVEQADGIQPGQPLTASYGTGDAIEATVTAIDPRMDPASRTVRVVVEVSNPEGRLRVGTSIGVELP